MPVPLMVRLDDDIAAKLRERSSRTLAPMNRIINDSLRKLFAVEGEGDSATRAPSQITTASAELLQEAREIFQTISGQETLEDRVTKLIDVVGQLLAIAEMAQIANEPDSAPLINATKRIEESEPSEAGPRARSHARL